MLTEKEFYTLRTIAFESGSITQRELVEATGYSLGTINKIVNSFIGKEYIDSEYCNGGNVHYLHNQAWSRQRNQGYDDLKAEKVHKMTAKIRYFMIYLV